MTDKQDVEAIFPLTPAQTGMLLESLRSPTAFIEQCSFFVDGELDRAALEAAWAQIVDRHMILRTAIAWKSQKQPLHVAFARLPTSLAWHELDQHDPVRAEADRQALLTAERERGIDVGKPPLARLLCAQLGARRFGLSITCHHLALDGWSLSLLSSELLRAVAARTSGRAYHSPSARPFRDYVAWLSKRDRDPVERFWRRALSGLEHNTPPGVTVDEPGDAPGSSGHVDLMIEREQSDALIELGRRAGVTLSAVIQALWAVLLARYNHSDRVVFGATFSGRPLGLRGAELMLGNFITTLPIVAHVAGDRPLSELAQALHRYNAELREFEDTPTSWIREWHGSLSLDSVLSFQNYPRDEDGPLRVHGIEFHGAHSRIPVMVLIVPGSQVHIRIVHDRGRVDEHDAARLAAHVGALIDGVVATPEAAVSTFAEAIHRDEFPKIHTQRTVRTSSSGSVLSGTQAALARIWSELLGVAQVGPDDSFFALGGHSLAATQLVTRIDTELRVRVPLAALFAVPTLAGLAAWVDEHRRDRTSPDHEGPPFVVDLAGRHQPFALLDIPRAYWMGESEAFELGDVVAHVYHQFEIVSETPGEGTPGEGGPLARLQAVLDRLVARHEALRVVLDADGTQRVLADVPAFPLSVENLRGCAPASVDARVHEVQARMQADGPSTSTWPLLEFHCQLLDSGRAVLHAGVALAICDGRGAQILFDEMCRLLRDPQAELEPIELGLRDYTMAFDRLRDTPAWQAAWRHWRARIVELPPPPELPLARLPSSLARQSMSRRYARLEPEAWTQICRRAAAQGLTPNAVLCTAYADVLARWSRSRDFTINVLYSNRQPLHAQANALVGNFSATLLLGLEHRGASFCERARALQARLWTDLEHGVVTGVEVLAEWNRARGEIGRAGMPVVFASTLADASASGDAIVLPTGWRERSSGLVTPQVFIDHNVFQREGALVYHWDVSDALFPDGLIDAMFSAYLAHLERLAADDLAWSEAARPPLLSPAPPPSLVSAPDVEPHTLASLFEARATNQPERPAVLCTRRTLSYAELERESASLAADLLANGARSGRLIAVMMDKGWEQVVACLAVVRAGAAYLPIDPTLPLARRQHLLERGEVEQILTQPWLVDALEWPAELRRVVVEPVVGSARALSGRGPHAQDLAYVIFTSGSTGAPKGVMIDHRGAVNTILDINQRFGIGPDDRVLALSSLSFDLSVYDLFGMLAAGGAIVMPDAAATREPARWLELVRQHRVSVWNSVPALMEMFVGQQEMAPSTLRLALLSGDWIPVSLPDRVRAQLPGIEVISLGGATEASIWSIVYPIASVDPAWPSIPYGRPLLDQDVLVLDAELEPCPEWVTGELYIAGIGLALGYWRDPDKTAASFLVHPRGGERLYRTGDLGRRLPDGNIEFLGREDDQVKIHGYRIELGEIEVALARHPKLRACAVVAVGEARGARRLVAHVVCDQDAPTSADLQRFLEQHLPAYMVPRQIQHWDELPLSANGKIDRRRLGEQAGRAAKQTFETTADHVEDALAELWREILSIGTSPGHEEKKRNVVEVGRTDNFFELGGTSLHAVQLMAKIRARFGVALPLSILFEGGTIAQLADVLRPGVAAPDWSPLVAIQQGGSRPPLVLVHPVGGNVLCYRELAALLGAEQPVYGLQAPTSSERAPVETIEAIARRYLPAVLELVPEGPLLLGGWSLGGAVAFELGRALQAHGRKLAAVIMFDTRMPRVEDRVDEHELVRRFLVDLGGGVAPAGVQGDSPSEILLDGARRAQALPDDSSIEHVRPLFDVFRTNSEALWRYAPEPDAQPVTLFRAAVQPDDMGEPSLGWSAIAGPALQIHDAGGDHYTMFRAPHLAKLAERLREVLATAVAIREV